MWQQEVGLRWESGARMRGTKEGRRGGIWEQEVGLRRERGNLTGGLR